MRNKMFSKSVKLTLSLVFIIVTTACVSHNDITSGKVISVNDDNASVYIAADTSTLPGKAITVRRLLPTNTVLEGEPLYSYQVVGKTVINAEDKANYISIKANNIAIKIRDIVELTE
tara:strand:+ start:7510 stop:7860 length:351 start_codon:yes stop_codon:yes gene_type:complete